jgi:FADH2 O2-dependent halogenase
VHHLFPGGWIWVLKFNNGITSAGVAATDKLANDLAFNSGANSWQRLLERLPSLQKIFGSAKAMAPFVHLPRLGFQSETVTGTRWAMLPSAAGFVDPLLSTGFPLTLLGLTRMGRLLRSGSQGPAFQKGLEEYADLTMLELETTSRLIAALYATLDRFALFKPLSLLYFAASSYSEAARRLGRPELAQGFLLCRNPIFSAQVRRFCDLATQPASHQDTEGLTQAIRHAVEPFDIAGLTDPARDPCYPANASDLLRNAHKLGATEGEILAMFERCGLAPEMAQGPSNTR